MKPAPALVSQFLIACVMGMLPGAGQAQNDPSFNASVEYYIHAMIPQPDGRLIVAGDLISLNGVWRDRIGRLNTDGSLDPSFNPDTNGVISAAAMLTNGQVLVGGNFSTFGGLPRAGLARLNADGTVDPAFTNGMSLEADALAVQADGKILIGGAFTNLAGQPRNNLGRLNANGSLDTAFNPNANGPVFSVAVQPDGRILVGGAFQSMGGQPANFICRLNTNGTLDTNFTASPNAAVYSLAVQPDGKILAGGPFWTMNGEYRYGLARLNANGSVDTNFNANVAPGYLSEVTTICIQCDGKILAGGSVSGWSAYPYFARFHSDGTTDTNFVVSAPSGVRSAVIQRDGKILRATIHSIARMTNTPATESLVYSNSIINWQRGGSAPEAWRTTFEYSTNRTNWTVIGAGTRVAGGWQRTGVSAPTNAFIRARGFTSGGFLNSSTYFVEAYAGGPVILAQPLSRTNNFATTALFSVVADGSPTLAYRWRKNGTNVTGATNATLTLTNVVKADAAAYAVIITNKFGAITSAVANLVVNDPFIITPPADQYVNAGDSASFNVTASGSGALKYRWLRNGSPVAGATNTSLTLTNAQGPDSGSVFRVVVTNSSGVLTSSPALLTVNIATVDTLNPRPNYEVYSIAVQPDGKILLAGLFSAFDGQTQSGVARLNLNGALDTNFNGSLTGIPFSPAEEEIALQPDGKILIAGGISYLNNTPRDRIGRLNPDGRLDASFNPGAEADIFAISALPDGKLLLAGSFTNLAGQPCSRIGRLNRNGTPDTNFVALADGTIYAITMQPDGRVLVGGNFTTLGGLARTNLGRLNTNGAVDLNFAPNANATVKAITVLTNGTVVVGGDFTTLAGQACNRLGRLGTNGLFDATFNPAPDGPIETLALEVSGRMIVGGTFTSIGGRSRTNLARLNNDGSAEMTFNPGADGAVGSLAIQPDGKLIVAGAFGVLNGQTRPFLGRLNTTATATNTLTFTTTNITWLRGGAGPEVWKASFEFTTNGTTWTQRDGSRIGGAWRVSGLSLSSNATIRARGFVSGSSDGSSWFAESSVGPVAILGQPTSLTNTPFTLAQFTVSAVGQPPLAYQWLKDGAPLTDTNNISGAQTPFLTLANVLGGDAAAYQVVISNATRAITSAVATLTVIDPLLTSQPASQTNNAGTTATFTASAIGTTNLSYQWLKNGTNLAEGGNISGASTTTLTLTNLLGGDAGAYQFVAANIWGSMTSAVASLIVIDPLIVTNPASQLAHRGQTATFTSFARGTEPLQYQWRKSGVDLPGEIHSSLTLTNVQLANGGGYDVIVTSMFGSVTSAVAVLTVNSATADSFNPGANNYVLALAAQSDGAILVGGQFTNLAGQAQQRIGRLHPDGAPDTSFFTSANNTVWALAVQTDGRVLAGGDFTEFSGQPTRRLGRLNLGGGGADGAFNPWPNGTVRSIAIQPDETILVGGSFDYISFNTRPYLARLFPNSFLDTSFTPTLNGPVYAIAQQPDGKILVGGGFTTVNALPRRGLVRLHPDGSVDTNFVPSLGITNFSAAYALVVQPDGRVVVGGEFIAVNGEARTNLARLNADGALDSSFSAWQPGSTAETVLSLSLQTDGKILVGGWLYHVAGQPRGGVARVFPDGTLDPDYIPGSGIINVSAQALQPDGKLVVGGSFFNMGGQPRGRIARIEPPEPATNTLTFDSTAIEWQRGGSATEVWRTTFEFTTNGVDWNALGAGTRTTNGWQLTGPGLPAIAVVRARGFVSGGSWFVETLAGPPLFVSEPVSQTVGASSDVGFNVTGVTGIDATYQWFKDGTPLADGGNVSGSQSASLILSSVFGADAGAFQVVAGNYLGSITSSVATLVVLDPLITAHPANQSVHVGLAASFSAGAIGTAPLNYRWLQNDLPLDGANALTLALTNVQATNAGAYAVVVSNLYGSVTSAVATLTVNLAVPDGFNPGANGQVNALAIQPDGKILVGGGFTILGGQVRYRLGRLLPDGTLDAGFNPGGNANSSNAYFNVSGLTVQPDGKILVQGSRSFRHELQTANLLWRLNSSGVEDTNFINGLDGTLNAVALQPDGKAWVGGSFTIPKPAITTNLVRLFSDGSLDSNFVTTVNSTVNTLALQPDGKLLVGGMFTTINGTNRNRIARFNTDGSLDTNFNPNAGAAVNTVTIRPDGKILLGGSFTTLGGTNRNRIARLNSDGTVDTNFNPNANGTVNTLALQADGKILIGGSFTMVGGQTRNRLARLNPDGSLDFTFNPGANTTVNAFAIQPDGAIVVGGGTGAGGVPLTQIGGQARTNIGRLVSTEPTSQALAFNGTTATWARSGPGPEFSRVTFEGSTNGVDWISLGNGTWITNGWQWAGTAFPLRSMVRARGFVTGGRNNGSGWFVESINPSAVPPEMLLGVAGLGVRGVSGQVVVVVATTDFTGWIPLQTNVVTDLGEFVFADLEAGFYPHRFYRARIFTGLLPAPSILNGSSLGFVGGGFGFDLTGTAGQSFIVETSTNLSLWTPLATNTLQTGATNFIDFGATNWPWLFYRLKVK
jgi:uncharacterized delta-60 repeat protein